MKIFILLLLLSFTTLASTVEDLINESQEIVGVQSRTEYFSRKFLGTDYDPAGPLGEGLEGEIDQDPLYRFDRFDCTTFLETVISLARSRDSEDFNSIINLIRYDKGEVDFLKRHHFTDLQWIPENIHAGFFKEANRNFFKDDEIFTARADIDIKGWINKFTIDSLRLPSLTLEEKQRRLLNLKERVKNEPVREATVEYIKIDRILENPDLLSTLPDVVVVNFVRPNWNLKETIGTNMNISHQGLLIRIKDQFFMRHATQVSPLKVVEVHFLNYLERFKNHPTLKGVHFLEILEH